MLKNNPASLVGQYLQLDGTATVWDAAKLYERHRLSSLPLESGGKECYLTGWPVLSVAELWQQAEADANIGVRLGDFDAFGLDLDDPRSWRADKRRLSGLGLPIVGCTSRQGGHLLLRTKAPEGFHRAELRGLHGHALGSHSQMVMPPSGVNGFRYRPIGRLQDIGWCEWRDIERWLKPGHCDVSSNGPMPVSLMRRDLPPRTKKLILKLRTAEHRRPVDGRFPSCSEAVFSVMAWAHTCGWSFDQIAPELQGVYEDDDLKRKWDWSMDHWSKEGIRPQLHQVFENAPDLLPDRESVDALVFDTALSEAYRFGGLEGGMFHKRQIMQLTGLSDWSVWHSLQRLKKRHLVDVIHRGDMAGYSIHLRREQ